MLEGIVFALATMALAYVSRASLRAPRSHGFYRFFAWELMLLLIVMNIDGWYDVPVSFDQTISGILMAISLIVIIMGYGILHQLGERDDSRDDGALLLFEKTSVLVTHGIYRYIRHPMYSSLIFLDSGLFFKRMSWLSGSIALFACVFLVITSLVEETENVRYFGAQYREYMKRTKRFVPFLV
ncbi:hypothetical protein GALL_92970 [mine drainage metagenome]|uniref:Isoprenylcysteine carboxyl methyltransferase (ICMT) family protein n=1 Tax=mine drainage metagenome TaxID=410659 RepID=A0A1J5SJC5_9ZZZZ